MYDTREIQITEQGVAQVKIMSCLVTYSDLFLDNDISLFTYVFLTDISHSCYYGAIKS